MLLFVQTCLLKKQDSCELNHRIDSSRKPHQKLKFSAGYGLDDPQNEDISLGDRSLNQCYFANVTWSPVKFFTVGLEGSQWHTEYLGANDAESFRLQTSFI